MLIVNKYRSKWTMYILKILNTNLLYLQGRNLGRNVHIRRSKHIRKYPQWYNPVFRASREWKSDSVKSLVYMLQIGYCYGNVEMDDILYLLYYWYSEDCMDATLKLHMREYYAL